MLIPAAPATPRYNLSARFGVNRTDHVVGICGEEAGQLMLTLDWQQIKSSDARATWHAYGKASQQGAASTVSSRPSRLEAEEAVRARIEPSSVECHALAAADGWA